MPTAQPDHLPEDKRWKMIELTMQRHDYRPDALIETLHAAQEAFGYLDTTALRSIATRLNIPPSKVYGVTTFYNHFNTKPKGDHTLVVCTGTACHVKGNDRIIVWMQEHYGLTPGQTSPDNKLSLVEVRCVGACALAPVVITDGAITSKTDFTDTTALIKEWLGDAA
jgi:bidirectional [NiFe] hydrogenase diaphorase subunit